MCDVILSQLLNISTNWINYEKNVRCKVFKSVHTHTHTHTHTKDIIIIPAGHVVLACTAWDGLSLPPTSTPKPELQGYLIPSQVASIAKHTLC